MPTYEYRCKACGEHLEVVQSFSDAPLTTCPACNGELRKVFGNVGIVFKGSGFYKTDSRSSATSSKSAEAAPKDPKESGDGVAASTKEPSATKESPAPAAAPATAPSSTPAAVAAS